MHSNILQYEFYAGIYWIGFVLRTHRALLCSVFMTNFILFRGLRRSDFYPLLVHVFLVAPILAPHHYRLIDLASQWTNECAALNDERRDTTLKIEQFKTHNYYWRRLSDWIVNKAVLDCILPSFSVICVVVCYDLCFGIQYTVVTVCVSTSGPFILLITSNCTHGK